MSDYRPGHELHFCLLLLICPRIWLLLVLQAVLWNWVSWRKKRKRSSGILRKNTKVCPPPWKPYNCLTISHCFPLEVEPFSKSGMPRLKPFSLGSTSNLNLAMLGGNYRTDSWGTLNLGASGSIFKL